MAAATLTVQEEAPQTEADAEEAAGEFTGFVFVSDFVDSKLFL